MSPSGVEVRPARMGEERAVLEMYEWLFAPPGERPAGFNPDHAQAAIANAIGLREATILLAVEHDRRIGLCSVYLDIESVRYGRRAWIEDLAVDPERRSRGVGAALLEAAREWATEHKATHLELDSGAARADAHRFYESHDPDWTGVQFAWSLSR